MVASITPNGSSTTNTIIVIYIYAPEYVSYNTYVGIQLHCSCLEPLRRPTAPRPTSPRPSSLHTIPAPPPSSTEPPSTRTPRIVYRLPYFPLVRPAEIVLPGHDAAQFLSGRAGVRLHLRHFFR